jgi:transcriptional regulator with XRE-family HTH domain
VRAGPDARGRFGHAVRVRREARGLTRDDLAGRARIHRTYLSDVEWGTRSLSPVNIERLAAALSVLVSELFAAAEAG